MSEWLLALLLLLPTIQYRFELGSVSFALVEPLALGLIGFLLVRQARLRGGVVLVGHPLLWLFLAFVVWTMLGRPWSANTTYGLSDIRDWAIPVLSCVVLVSTVKVSWQRLSAFWLAVGVGQALLTLYQAKTGSARFFISGGTALYKRVIVAGETGELPLASFGTGLFSHPNSAGFFFVLMLLVWGAFMLSLRGWARLLLLPVGGVLAVALYFTYAKTSMLTAFLLLPLLLVGRYRVGRYVLPLVPLTSLLAASLLIFLTSSPSVYADLPVELDTVGWRFELWADTMALLEESPGRVLVGNGDVALAEAMDVPFIHPHNLPLYFLLYYGLPGLMFLVGFVLLLTWVALQSGALFQRVPLLTAMYLALCAFLVAGIIDVIPNNLDMRMILLLCCAALISLQRPQRTAPASLPVSHALPRSLARPHSV